jgi:hypothetical protein
MRRRRRRRRRRRSRMRRKPSKPILRYYLCMCL